MARLSLAFASIMLAGTAGTTYADVLTFDDIGVMHGQIIGLQYSGVTISAVNPAQSFDYAAIFDTTQTGTSDPDLEDPWSSGNLPSGTILGNVLIVAENDTGFGDGILDDPDDQAGSVGQYLRFEFDSDLVSFGMDIIDVEGSNEDGFYEFFNDGVSLGTIAWSDFMPGGAREDLSIIFGDNSANTFPTLSSGDIGGVFDEVRVHLGGSAAIDNITFQSIPAPGAAALLLACFAGQRRRRK